MYDLTFEGLQGQVGEWSRKNFPNNESIDPAMGLVEELGELFHALLKERQGIRGSKATHEAAAKDAIGDLLIYMADFCERKGWSMQEIVEDTWNVVKQRDWTRNKDTGVAVSNEAIMVQVDVDDDTLNRLGRIIL